MAKDLRVLKDERKVQERPQVEKVGFELKYLFGRQTLIQTVGSSDELAMKRRKEFLRAYRVMMEAMRIYSESLEMRQKKYGLKLVNRQYVLDKEEKDPVKRQKKLNDALDALNKEAEEALGEKVLVPTFEFSEGEAEAILKTPELMDQAVDLGWYRIDE